MDKPHDDGKQGQPAKAVIVIPPEVMASPGANWWLAIRPKLAAAIEEAQQNEH